jgi:hypothetical protein
MYKMDRNLSGFPVLYLSSVTIFYLLALDILLRKTNTQEGEYAVKRKKCDMVSDDDPWNLDVENTLS